MQHVDCIPYFFTLVKNNTALSRSCNTRLSLLSTAIVNESPAGAAGPSFQTSSFSLLHVYRALSFVSESPREVRMEWSFVNSYLYFSQLESGNNRIPPAAALTSPGS